MKDIITVDADKIAKVSQAPLFFIILQTENGRNFTWRGDGFGEVIKGSNDAFIFSKDELVSQYGQALLDARMETDPSLFETGRLDVVPIGLGV